MHDALTVLNDIIAKAYADNQLTSDERANVARTAATISEAANEAGNSLWSLASNLDQRDQDYINEAEHTAQLLNTLHQKFGDLATRLAQQTSQQPLPTRPVRPHTTTPTRPKNGNGRHRGGESTGGLRLPANTAYNRQPHGQRNGRKEEFPNQNRGRHTFVPRQL
jgi:hypothetical protein